MTQQTQICNKQVPVDVLLRVAEYLQVNDLCNAALCNTAFAHVFSHDIIWQCKCANKKKQGNVSWKYFYGLHQHPFAVHLTIELKSDGSIQYTKQVSNRLNIPILFAFKRQDKSKFKFLQMYLHASNGTVSVPLKPKQEIHSPVSRARKVHLLENESCTETWHIPAKQIAKAVEKHKLDECVVHLVMPSPNSVEDVYSDLDYDEVLDWDDNEIVTFAHVKVPTPAGKVISNSIKVSLLKKMVYQ